MDQIKIIGPKNIVAPLAILGLVPFPAEDEQSARAALAQAAGKKEPALIMLTERLARGLTDEINKLNAVPGLNIVLIPDNRGGTGLARREIQTLLKNAIGAKSGGSND